MSGKAKFRLIVSDHFDELIRQIDLEVEKTIVSIGENEVRVAEINQRREQILAVVERVKLRNLDALESAHQTEVLKKLDEESVMRQLFKSFCFRIEYDRRMLIVVTDVYLSTMQIKAYESFLEIARNRKPCVQQLNKMNDLFDFIIQPEANTTFTIDMTNALAADPLSMVHAPIAHLLSLDRLHLSNMFIASVRPEAAFLFAHHHHIAHLAYSYDIGVDMNGTKVTTPRHIATTIRAIARPPDRLRLDLLFTGPINSIGLPSRHVLLAAHRLFAPLHGLHVRSLVCENLTGMQCHLEIAPETMSHLINVTEFELIAITVDKIRPGSFQDHPTLQKLRFDNLKVDHDIDVETFRGASNLREMILSSVSLDADLTLHNDAFDDLTKLEVLALTNCGIHELRPGLFARLTGLRELYLNGNKISRIGSRFFEFLPKLKVLNVANNRIREVPSVCEVLSLERLAIGDDSGVDSDRREALSTLLVELDLSGNHVEKLYVGLFSGFAHLTSLRLGGNKIGRLDVGVFGRLTRLTSLDLSRNQIRRVEALVFADLASLEVLLLNGNRIERVQADVFAGLDRLVELNLSCNPIVVGCVAASQLFRKHLPKGCRVEM